MFQYKRDYETPPGLRQTYLRLVKKNRQNKSEGTRVLDKKQKRKEKEAELREKWDSLSQEERWDRINTLEDVCNKLIQAHPKFKGFIKVRIIIEDGFCGIHWNGKDPDETSGFSIMDKHFPIEEIDINIERYRSRLYKAMTDNDDDI